MPLLLVLIIIACVLLWFVVDNLTEDPKKRKAIKWTLAVILLALCVIWALQALQVWDYSAFRVHGH